MTSKNIMDAANTVIAINMDKDCKESSIKVYKNMCGVYYKLGNEEIVSTGYWSECEDDLQEKANKLVYRSN